MKQSEYLGYWVVGQTEQDFQSKCRKISNGHTRGFRTVSEHIAHLQSRLEKDRVNICISFIQWLSIRNPDFKFNNTKYIASKFVTETNQDETD